MKYFVAAAALAASLCFVSSTQAANDLYMHIGAIADAPFGWKGFCIEYAPECDTKPLEARTIVLSTWHLEELKLVNAYVNTTVTPMTDAQHWGFADLRFVFLNTKTGRPDVERWNYPDDGYGDCEDYVLAKRRMLLRAGWPRRALLITVVLDTHGDGHAVLTVKTDKGEFILDNLRSDIVLWSQTGYRFIKRQSQTDPNIWVSLDDGSQIPVASAPLRITIYAQH